MSNPESVSWDVEADVVVVGGGNAGLPAAIEARQRGAEVVIVEVNDFLGGLMRGSGGFMFFCDTHVQRRNGIEDSVEWGVDDEMRMSDQRAVPAVVRAYVAGGADTCRWLERLGLTWSDALRGGDWSTDTPPHRRVPRTHYAAASPTGYYPGGGDEGQCGYALTVVLEKAVASLRIPVLHGYRMRRIWRVPDGPVTGIATDSPRGPVNIRARRGVVLAAGGATSNEQLVRAWDPRLVNDATYSDGLPYMTSMGDALLAGEEVGAGLTDMSFVSFIPVRYGTHYYSLSLSAIAGEQGIAKTTGVPVPSSGGYQRIVLVANDGRRFLDESLATRVSPHLPRDVKGTPVAEYPEEPFWQAFYALPEPKNVWAVTDAAGAAAMRWPVAEMLAPRPMGGHALHPDSVAVADTPAELAKLIRVVPHAFVETIRDYNASVRRNCDAQHGKPPPLFSLDQPPYYAAKFNVIRHTPAGGLRVNSRAQVLDRRQLWDGRTAVGIDDEATIPRLYAAGDCAGFVGFRRSHRKTGPIIVMGRIAGGQAASEPLR